MELNWEWLNDTQSWILVVLLAFVVPTTMTLKAILDELRNINRNLYIIRTGEAPSPFSD